MTRGRYDIPDPRCKHCVQRTRVYAGDRDGGPYASVWVCPREECVEDAKAWAFAKTHRDVHVVAPDIGLLA